MKRNMLSAINAAVDVDVPKGPTVTSHPHRRKDISALA
jgi:hypothetical protein